MSEPIGRKEFESAMRQIGLHKVCLSCGVPEVDQNGRLSKHIDTCNNSGYAGDWTWVRDVTKD